MDVERELYNSQIVADVLGGSYVKLRGCFFFLFFGGTCVDTQVHTLSLSREFLIEIIMLII